jgi:flagellar basal body rod protein FlgG
MIRGFWTARSGLLAHQEHMNTIANNMANVNTIGFKPMRTAFTDLLYQNINRAEVENETMVGHGVKINKNDPMMAQGALEPSDRPLDLALLEDNSFFAVQDAQDNVYYTRAGNFWLSQEDDTFYLVGATGERVLDAEGGQIEIEFDEDGDMIWDPSVVGVYNFPNPYGLSLTGGNMFAATEMSGEAAVIEEPKIRQNYIERSGTYIADEMSNVVIAQKAFNFASRMVMVSDEVEQTINSLRG